MKQISYEEVQTKVRELVADLIAYKNIGIALNEKEEMRTVCGNITTLKIMFTEPVPEADGK